MDPQLGSGGASDVNPSTSVGGYDGVGDLASNGGSLIGGGGNDLSGSGGQMSHQMPMKMDINQLLQQVMSIAGQSLKEAEEK